MTDEPKPKKKLGPRTRGFVGRAPKGNLHRDMERAATVATYYTVAAGNAALTARMTEHDPATIRDWVQDPRILEMATPMIEDLRSRAARMLDKVMGKYEDQIEKVNLENKGTDLMRVLGDMVTKMERLKIEAQPQVNINLNIDPEAVRWAVERKRQLIESGATEEQIAQYAPDVLELCAMAEKLGQGAI